MSARRQNRQPRSHGASHVEQREAVDYRVELIQTVDLRKAPGGVDLIAVRQTDKLRASGRAAGMEERAYGVAVRHKPEVQGGALRQQALIEADDLTARIAFAANEASTKQRRQKSTSLADRKVTRARYPAKEFLHRPPATSIRPY